MDEVRRGHVRAAEEVDERLGAFFVLAALRDAHGVREEIEAFLREAEREVRILFDHRQIVSRVVGRSPCLAALEFVENLVHDIGL